MGELLLNQHKWTFFGCILIICSSFTSSFGLYLQNKVAKYTGQRGSVSYFSLAQLTYPQFSIVFDSAISIKCFGVDCGDYSRQRSAAGALYIDASNFWISLFMAFIVAPLSYLKKLNSLKIYQLCALFSVGYLICLVIEKYIALSIHKQSGGSGGENGAHLFSRSIIPVQQGARMWIG
ncbi:unnamed protein product [Candida parapsilosis]